MDSYVDYNYYINTFGGAIVPQEDFKKCSVRASEEIRLRILNKDITAYKDLVKKTTCSVTELIYNQEQLKTRYNKMIMGTESGIVTSEKVGDYSRTISNISFDQYQYLCSDEWLSKEITKILERELLFTGLLNRGVNVR